MARWHELGTYLDVSKASLDAIDAGHTVGDMFGKLTDVISKWIRREKESHRPSWRVLCEALEGMGERGLAETIAQKYPRGKINLWYLLSCVHITGSVSLTQSMQFYATCRVSIFC